MGKEGRQVGRDGWRGWALAREQARCIPPTAVRQRQWGACSGWLLRGQWHRCKQPTIAGPPPSSGPAANCKQVDPREIPSKPCGQVGAEHHACGASAAWSVFSWSGRGAFRVRGQPLSQLARPLACRAGSSLPKKATPTSGAAAATGPGARTVSDRRRSEGRPRCTPTSLRLCAAPVRLRAPMRMLPCLEQPGPPCRRRAVLWRQGRLPQRPVLLGSLQTGCAAHLWGSMSLGPAVWLLCCSTCWGVARAVSEGLDSTPLRVLG